ncbi:MULTISPECIES: ABC transporter ATP-binding protein [Cellulomonas]|uniref:Macrolide ABC transporter ATP-binding protein n=2 Tax=Cellulomonas TaxID=1707 RepID=A0A4Y3KPN0_9CELL|nr:MULTISPECIES: ATP-binding cassette domain-containing protein [Cellulomonas]MCR6704299.1 ATP-binding cassette domain-containing protein [Cellulomonas sp.]GEA85992.1 macrolide ABC transporter ATP-binding protein [Cellulomonas gelida]GGL21745.1 macrolide ABC transporter ATP-binding protein [Cellulomonas gelida]
MGALLVADDVVVRFGATPALSGASMSVSSGEAVALVGPSGAGKSTLLLCLAGLERPSAGAVQYSGSDLAGLRVEDLAQLRLREFGFVFQGGDLMAELTLAENVELPLRLAGASRRDARARASRLLDELGVADAAGRRPGEVSGGQAQRAAVARAVAHAPAVVFADEPTGALDSVNARAVLEVLLAATRAVGASLVMVTHDRSLATLTDRVLEVHDGRVGPPTGGLPSAEQLFGAASC